MTDGEKLVTVKIIHTIIWLFFNVVIFYFVYAVWTNKIDIWAWICLGLIATEGVVLLVFKNICPVTIWARRFSDSAKDNFDIYLPGWLARYNKQIYTAIVLFGFIILMVRLIS